MADEQDKQDEQSKDEKKGDLNDLLQELRILLQGAQVLTAFLTILPFSAGFKEINDTEKWIFVVTFLCSLTSLVLYSAPAGMHRLMRPVQDREKFKNMSSTLMIAGFAFASLALVLSSQIVVSAVVGEPYSWVIAAGVAVIIGVLWWIIPLSRRSEI